MKRSIIGAVRGTGGAVHAVGRAGGDVGQTVKDAIEGAIAKVVLKEPFRKA